MVSALDSGSSGPGSSPGWRHCVVLLGTHFTLTVPFSTLMPGQRCDGIASHPGGSTNIPSYFTQQKSE